MPADSSAWPSVHCWFGPASVVRCCAHTHLLIWNFAVAHKAVWCARKWHSLSLTLPMPSLVLFSSGVFMRAEVHLLSTKRSGFCSDRGQCLERNRVKGALSGGGVQKEEEKCRCEWLSSTCKHAGMSAVTVKTSSRNDHAHVCVLAVLPLTDYQTPL